MEKVKVARSGTPVVVSLSVMDNDGLFDSATSGICPEKGLYESKLLDILTTKSLYFCELHYFIPQSTNNFWYFNGGI